MWVILITTDELDKLYKQIKSGVTMTALLAKAVALMNIHC